MKRMVESEIADILNEKLQVDENGIELKDNLHVDGKISGGEIVEDMSGYSFTKSTMTEPAITYLYAGVVKNGNKLTFCIAAKLDTTVDLASGSSPNIGEFTVPSDIFDKLIPFSSRTLTNVLDIKSGSLNSYVTTNVATNNVIYKTASALQFRVYPRATAPANDSYYVRFEATFLLADNMAA